MREREAFDVKFAPGLVEDETGFLVGKAGFVEVNGVRPHRKGMQTVRGYESYTTSTFSGICRGLFAWTDNLNQQNIAIGTHTGLYVEVGGGLYDITPGGEDLLTEDGQQLLAEDDTVLVTESPNGFEDGYGGAGYGTGGYGEGPYGTADDNVRGVLTYSFGQYGQNLIANPRGWGIYQWQNDTAQKAAPISGAPEQVDSILVTDRHVIAYGCNEEDTGDYNPRCIRWCDFEDLTDWTTGTADNAGEYVLDDTGRIIRALQLGSNIFVWTNDGIYVQQFVGAPGQTYFFERIASGCGLIGPNAITKLGQTAYWMSPDKKFWLLAFGMGPVRMPGPIEKDMADNIALAQEEKVYASTRTEFEEIRFYVPDGRDDLEDECSRYFAYNTRDKKWFSGLHARTADLDDDTLPYPIATDESGNLFFEEKGFTANGGKLTRSCKTGFLYLRKGARVIMLRRLWPDFDDWQGNISLTVYSKMSPNGAETTHGPYTIRPTDEVIDLDNICGALFAFEWSCEAGPAFWRIGEPTMNGVIRGRGLR